MKNLPVIQRREAVQDLDHPMFRLDQGSSILVCPYCQCSVKKIDLATNLESEFRQLKEVAKELKEFLEKSKEHNEE